MKFLSYQNSTVWLDHDELEPLFDFLKDNQGHLGGSELYDDMVNAYIDSADALTELKEGLNDKITELEKELEG